MESGWIRPAQRQSHNAASRRRWRRNCGNPNDVPGEPALSIRNDAARRRLYVANTDAVVSFPYEVGKPG